jgi:hypothetical protein
MLHAAAALFCFVVAASLTACQASEPKPAEAAPPKPALEPGPLPPEEVPSEEAPPALDPPDAKPVEPGITATGAPTRGKLPKAVIDEKLKSAEPGITACYERGLKSKPDLRGVVSVSFVVGTDGKVVHAQAAEGDDALPDGAVVECILGEIKKLEFPPPSGGRVFVDYPLRLEPPRPTP